MAADMPTQTDPSSPTSRISFRSFSTSPLPVYSLFGSKIRASSLRNVVKRMHAETAQAMT